MITVLVQVNFDGELENLKKIRVAIIGFGYWGPNIARNFALNPYFDLVYIVEKDESRRLIAQESFNVTTLRTHHDITVNDEIELLVICTRPAVHLDLAEYFAPIVKNILIMKPSGINLEQAIKIDQLSISNPVNIFCDFTYLFSPITQFIQTHELCKGVLMEMTEYTSYRTSLGIVQADVDVLADLAIHDISILLEIKKSLPRKVNCIPTDSVNTGQMKSAFMTLTWDDGFKASVHVGWNSPKKVRQVTIMGMGRSIYIEELNKESPLSIIGFQVQSSDYSNLPVNEKIAQNISYFLGDIEVPKIEQFEALSMEVSCLKQTLRNEQVQIKVPRSALAVNCWRVLESLMESAAQEGVTTYVK